MAFQEYYPHLFTPMTVGKHHVVFKNRVFTAPMSTEHDPASHVMLDDGVEFYAQKARGGAGCVHVGETRFDEVNSTAHPAQLDLIHTNTLLQLNKFNNYAHAYGARTSVELNHAGHFAVPAFNDGHTPPMSATARLMPNGNMVREMTEEDMDYVANIYANAVHMAWRGGFDMACLHYGHGWLMGGWLSPLLNQRTDRHGGSLENRMRFPRMVIERIRQKVGDNMLLEVRLSGDEMSPGGIVIEDTIEYIKMIEDVVDLVHISCGTRWDATTRGDMHPTNFVAVAHNAPMSLRVKQAGIKIPVGCVGGINTPELAEWVLSEGMADYVLMARPWVADPEWANKARAGRSADIRPCIRCNNCTDGALRKSIATAVLDDDSATLNFACAVNPLHGAYAYKGKFPPAGISMNVVVVGGGVAGMQAALEAVERGHKVTLYEASDRLGGQLKLFPDHLWFKKDVARLREYLVKQVLDAPIQIHYNTKATPEIIDRLNADAVIVAIGAEPFIPPIPGVDRDNVHLGVDLFGREEIVGKQVVIIGGGQVGCEMAIHLGERGCVPTVVEMGPHLAPDAKLSCRLHLLRQMDRTGNITSHTGLRCTSIEDDGVHVVDGDGNEQVLPADTVVLCTGYKSLADQRDAFRGTAFHVIPAGDCVQPGLIKDAIRTGFDAALSLHKF